MEGVSVIRAGVGERCVRLVCISDTHGKHWDLLARIPEGDILVHAGDFSYKLRSDDPLLRSKLNDFNDFLGALPHRHKIVIAGNHEIAFNDMSPSAIQQRLSNCHYLQDSSVEIEGLKFYGSPWTTSSGMGFSMRSKHIDNIWSRIPSDVDVLITHLPPLNRLDLAFDSRAQDQGTCSLCKKRHPQYSHWGNADLLKRVHQLKPMVHIFGHVHDSNGHHQGQDTLYINAAMDLKQRAQVVDLYIPASQHHEVAETQEDADTSQEVSMTLDDTDGDFIGIDELKSAQTSQSGMWTVNLRKLRRTVQPSHRAVSIREFPVWMLPVDCATTDQGLRFAVNADTVQALLQDEQYMAQYREAAWLLVRLWGWDLYEKRMLVSKEPPPSAEHLYLAARSFQLFQQYDLLESLETFVNMLGARQDQPQQQQQQQQQRRPAQSAQDLPNHCCTC